MSDRSNETSRRDALKLVAGTGSALVLGSSAATGLAAAENDEYWRNVVASKTSDEIGIGPGHTLQLSLTVHADDDLLQANGDWLTGVGWSISIQGESNEAVSNYIYEVEDVEVEYLPDQNLESNVEYEDGASQTDRRGNEASEALAEMVIAAAGEIPGGGVATSPIEIGNNEIETPNRGSGEAVKFLKDTMHAPEKIGGSARFRYYEKDDDGNPFNGRISFSATVTRLKRSRSLIPQETVNESIEVTVPFEPNKPIWKYYDEDDNGEIGDFEILGMIEDYNDDTPIPGTDDRTITEEEMDTAIEKWRNS